MAEGQELQLHFTQRLVNVQWESGLAVIFGEEDLDAPKQEKE